MNHCTYIIDIYYKVLQNVYSSCILLEDIWKFWNKYNWIIITQLFLSLFCIFIFLTI